MYLTEIPLRFIPEGEGHDNLLEKNPAVQKAIKDSFKRVQQLEWEMAEDFLISKQE